MGGAGGERQAGSVSRVATAVLIGLAGSCVLWVAAPYNDHLVGNALLCDSYLPVAALAVALLIVLVVNPALHRWAPGLALRRRQLALIFGMLLVACVLPGQGLLRMLPYSLARVPQRVAKSEKLAQVYERMGLPRSLFPAELRRGPPPAACEHFTHQLP